MGRQFHRFPKGTFKAHFIPPALPKSVASHLVSHPPVWSWSVKAGPNKGKTFQVPTIPIACDKTAPKAVQWIVAIFHSFKSHLNPIAIDAETGKVHQAWLRLYQNNLYIHIHSQLKACPPAKGGPPSTKPATATPNPSHTGPKADSSHPQVNPLVAEVRALQAEVWTLKDKLYKYIASHKACCQRSDSSPSTSSEAADDDDEGDPPSPPNPAHPPFELLVQRPDSITVPMAKPPSWLTTVLSRIDLPPSFSGALYAPDCLAEHLPRTATNRIPGTPWRNRNQFGGSAYVRFYPNPCPDPADQSPPPNDPILSPDPPEAPDNPSLHSQTNILSSTDEGPLHPPSSHSQMNIAPAEAPNPPPSPISNTTYLGVPPVDLSKSSLLFQVEDPPPEPQLSNSCPLRCTSHCVASEMFDDLPGQSISYSKMVLHLTLTKYVSLPDGLGEDEVLELGPIFHGCQFVDRIVRDEADEEGPDLLVFMSIIGFPPHVDVSHPPSSHFDHLPATLSPILSDMFELGVNSRFHLPNHPLIMPAPPADP
ncbi:hypothetical protein EDD15DRAFT_2369641 [Pisolithus albus]|nr:hypothetical protein EDD15DRAFT_2369641 [Pisolithus albus]